MKSFEKVDSKWIVPAVFLALILIGFFLTTGKAKQDAPAEIAPAAPVTAPVEVPNAVENPESIAAVAVDPWAVAFTEPVLGEEPSKDEVDAGHFTVLLPMTESAPAEPVIARNGDATPTLLEPAVEPVEVAEEPQCASVDFVPFVCIYKPARGRNKSDWVYYFFPGNAAAPVCPPVPQKTFVPILHPMPVIRPVFYPVYYPVPVVVFPTCPARFGRLGK